MENSDRGAFPTAHRSLPGGIIYSEEEEKVFLFSVGYVKPPPCTSSLSGLFPFSILATGSTELCAVQCGYSQAHMQGPGEIFLTVSY